MRWAVFSFCCLVFAEEVRSRLAGEPECSLPFDLKKEISGYQNLVNAIIKEATVGKYAGKFYDDLAAFVDKFGNRLAGTKNLEDSIKYIKGRAESKGLKTHLEPVQVPYWTRGQESAQLVFPRVKNLRILGLGHSPGTTGSGITSNVVVVSDFAELTKKAKEIPGKIVLFNYKYTNYGDSVPYRTDGPAKASRLGAAAALVRSVTPFSIDSPHTGITRYGREKPIPAAAVTLEDADMIARMYKAGLKPRVTLKMGAKFGADQMSNNIIFDIPGHALPNHYVTVSGHIDSWDVGQGALDDGGGAFLALHSLLLLKSIGVPPPKRTIRGIMWTGEEIGLMGAYAYLQKHKDEFKNWTAALESDGGLFKPLGVHFNGNHDAFCVMQELMALFKNLKATKVMKNDWVGSDIVVFKQYGVPLVDPFMEEKNYMWFHHSDGDSMRTQNSTAMSVEFGDVCRHFLCSGQSHHSFAQRKCSAWDLLRILVI